MSVKRYQIQLYHWTTKRLRVERTFDPTDANILREHLESLVKEQTGKDNPVLDRWWIRVYALNGVKICDCRLDPAGRTVVKR